MKKVLLVIPLLLILGFFIVTGFGKNAQVDTKSLFPIVENDEDKGGPKEELHPLSIEYLRKGEYSGSDITIEQTLPPGSNYDSYIASYKSDGLKIYALLTVPQGEVPAKGWPVVVFNHGYISPSEYRTTERYIEYTDAFSRNGYILFRPDYRGHGNSEGQASGGYGSNGYTIDVLNAVASIKKYKGADKEKIGMWGHSMGGYITFRSMVINKDIKAGVIWAGVVASYQDLIYNWRRATSISVTPPLAGGRASWRQSLIQQYGTPEKNPQFWNSISANSFLKDISGPVQIPHGTEDASVPVAFSEKLDKQLKETGKESELFVYQGDDHNIGNNLNTALDHSVSFFDKILKTN